MYLCKVPHTIFSYTKKCKKCEDVLFINAVEEFEKGQRQNNLGEVHIKKIVDTYKNRKEETRYSRKVSMAEIEKNEYNLNISRYVSTAKAEEPIHLEEVNKDLITLNEEITKARNTHNKFLKELGLPPI